jgi:16S rRNA (guanine527-N7)-methyltransferase
MSSALDPLRPRLFEIAEQLGMRLVDTDADTLLAYLALLQRWNATYNLTAVREPERMLTQHLADCLAVIEPLRRRLDTGRAARLLDVGSGGGLPGVVIAILCPTLDVTCVDTVGKKAAFIQQVAASLRLSNLHSQHARVEQLKSTPFDVVTSRAFASLTDFVALTRSHLIPDAGVWLAMKGKDPADERAALPADIDVFHVEQLHVPGLDAERCLVWMRPRRSL